MKSENTLKIPLPFRPCVGIAVFNKDGRVWAGRRISRNISAPPAASVRAVSAPAAVTKECAAVKQSETDKLPASLWQLPQGGIEPHESPVAAAKRELWEETGIKSVQLLAESREWLTYELPAAVLAGKNGYKPWGGRYRGQKQKWFAFLFTGEQSEIAVNPPPSGCNAEFSAWAWRDLTEIAEQAVAFKRPVYQKIAAEFASVIGDLRFAAKNNSCKKQ